MLTEQLSRYFTAATRRRGSAYHYGGAVHIVNSDESFIYARVAGSRDYDVMIDIRRESRGCDVLASCTCPYADGGHGDYCKHLWATLLQAESQNLVTRPLPPRITMELTPVDECDDDYDDDDDDDGIDLDETFDDEIAPESVGRTDPERPAGRGGRTNGRTSEAREPEWARLLAQLAARSYDHERPRPQAASTIQPIYVLEPPTAIDDRRFTLSLAEQRVTSSGTLCKIKKLALKPSHFAQLETELDRRICLMLIGADPPEAGYRYYSYANYSAASYRPAASTFHVPDEVLPTLLPMLVDTGRFRYRVSPNADPMPLRWDDGPPWEFVISINRSDKGEAYCLTAHLRRDDNRRVLNQKDHLIQGDPDLLIHDGTLCRVQSHDCLGWIDVFRRQAPVSLGVSDRDAVLRQFATLARVPPIEWPTDWNIAQVTGVAPRPELSLAFEEQTGGYSRSFASGAVRFQYEGTRLDPTRGGAVVLDPAGRRQIHRDLAAEQRCVGRLLELGMEPDPYGSNLRVLVKKIPALVHALLEEGWTVLGNDKLFRHAGSFSIDVTTGIDWFDLDSTVDFDGQTVALPTLLEAAQKGERFVRLGDGSMGMLPEQWLAKYGALLSMGREHEGRVRFSKTQLGLIDALVAQLPEATFDKNFAAARAKLRHFDGIKTRKAPRGFRGTLRGYQEQGLAWLHFLNDFGWGGCLADDMGLGKTVQALAMLARAGRSKPALPSLVVMPKSIVFNWQREAQRFAPKLRVVDYTGLDRKSRREQIKDSDLVFTTYGTLRRDVDFLRKHEFHYAILDEAQAIKNPKSLSAKATRLLNARHRLVMTGTPVENHLGDLWSLFEFLNPGMLGNSRIFKDVFSPNGAREASSANVALLNRMLRPFILRRTKEHVAKELPARSEQTLECALSPRQAACYNEMRDYYRASLLGRVDEMGLAKSKVYVLEALLRLRQAACHPGLIDPSRADEDCAKLETLLPMISELVNEGHKALVFSQFTSMLAIVRNRLDREKLPYEYLDGRTRKRDECVDRFQTDPNCRLFLISLKAGGTGLNLTAADYVFILDPWWNPAVEAQAIDRTHRIGQDKKVIAYRLIARDTVESKILELQKSKRNLAEAIINQSNSLIQDLTRDDLDILLS